MAKNLLLFTINRGDKTRLIAHFNRIIANVPTVFGKTAENLLKEDAIPVARQKIIDSRVSYKKKLENSFIVRKSSVPGGKAVSLINVQPYAVNIDTGKVPNTVWRDSSSQLDSWRAIKGIVGGNQAFVKVGQSGGGNRLSGVPYPLGVHFMEAGYTKILGTLNPKLKLALDLSMR